MSEGKHQEETGIIDAIVQDEPQALAVREPGRIMRGTVDDVLSTMNDLKLIRTFIASEMHEGVDFGAIPGTDQKKKNMLLPGAQKVNMFFNVRPEYSVERVELGDGHVEFIVHAHLFSRNTGLEVGAGVGSCCTMEGKYRYRNTTIDTGEPVPKAYWKDRNPDLIGGKEFSPIKIDGAWHIARKGEKIENDNIYDVRNTVLKMAKKRALVDASIGLGCLSELFTQDLEDIFDIQVSGAGQAGGEGRTQTNPPTLSEDAPSQPSNVDRAPQKRATGRSASGNEVSEGKATIHVKGVGARKGSEPETQRASVRDTDDVWWMFHGWENIDRAITSQKSGRALSVTYDIKGEFRNVRSTEWTEES